MALEPAAQAAANAAAAAAEHGAHRVALETAAQAASDLAKHQADATAAETTAGTAAEATEADVIVTNAEKRAATKVTLHAYCLAKSRHRGNSVEMISAFESYMKKTGVLIDTVANYDAAYTKLANTPVR